MAEAIGLIERAAALLRQLDANESAPLPPPAREAGAGHGGPELVLDRGRLASYGITVPSVSAIENGRRVPPREAKPDDPILTRRFEYGSTIQPANHGYQCQAG